MNEQEVEKLRESLDYLGEHIRILKRWMQRGGTDPRIVECVDVLGQQFEETSRLVPPKTP